MYPQEMSMQVHCRNSTSLVASASLAQVITRVQCSTEVNVEDNPALWTRTTCMADIQYGDSPALGPCRWRYKAMHNGSISQAAPTSFITYQ